MAHNLRVPARPRIVALPAYLLLAALFYLPQLLGLRAFPAGDFNHHFLPFSLFLRSEVLAARLPVWNPYTFSGHPFLADVQAAVFYPIGDILLAVTLPFGSPAARLYFLEVEAALHVALAGFFTYLLVRELTGRRGAAFLAGCVFAFSGYLTGYPPQQLSVLRTAIWLPLVLWLLLRGLGRPEDLRFWRKPQGVPEQGWRWIVYAALAYTAAFLAGHSQTFLYLTYVVAGWIVLLGARQLTNMRRSGGSTRGLIPLVLRVLVFAGLFLALSAAQLWPSLEFAGLSVRSRADYAYLSGGLPLHDTWQMLLPGLISLWSPLYVGVIALGLAGAGLAAPFWRHAPGAFALARDGGTERTRRPAVSMVIFFAGMALLALLLSYGGGGFIYPIFYRYLPGWDLFRDQERAAYLVAFGLSTLAGYGAAWVAGTSPRRICRVALQVAALMVAGEVIFVLFWVTTGRVDLHGPALWRACATTFVLAALVAVAGWQLPRHPGWERHTPIALVALALADLFLANWSLNAGPLTPAQAAAPPAEAQVLQSVVQAAGSTTVGLPPRIYNEYRIYDDYGMLAGLEDVRGSSPLWLAHYAALFDDFPLERMWQLTGAGYVLSGSAALGSPFEILYRFGSGLDSTYLHRLTQPQPRAWIVPVARVAGDTAARAALADRQNFDPDQTALLAAGQVLPPGPAAAGPGANRVRLTRLAPAHLLAEVQSERGGWLVIAENWLPGWVATSQSAGGTGANVPVLRADLAFLAMPVSAGQSRIDLAYRPASVGYGLAISGAAALILLFLWLVPARRRFL